MPRIIPRILTIALAFAVLSGCSNQQTDLKSPCVGAEDSPCDRRPVNDWWINGGKEPV